MIKYKKTILHKTFALALAAAISVTAAACSGGAHTSSAPPDAPQAATQAAAVPSEPAAETAAAEETAKPAETAAAAASTAAGSACIGGVLLPARVQFQFCIRRIAAARII